MQSKQIDKTKLIRISEDRHQAMKIKAAERGISLRKLTEGALDFALFSQEAGTDDEFD